MEYGYIRVSSKEQNIDRQLDAFKKMELNRKNIFIDKQSDKNFERPSYKRLLKRLKKGDLVIIKSIDRLDRNYGEMLEQWRLISTITIDGYAFGHCTSLSSVTITANVRNIGYHSFGGGTKSERVRIPHSVETVGTNPFVQCAQLTYIEVDKNSSGFFNDFCAMSFLF